MTEPVLLTMDELLAAIEAGRVVGPIRISIAGEPVFEIEDARDLATLKITMETTGVSHQVMAEWVEP